MTFSIITKSLLFLIGIISIFFSIPLIIKCDGKLKAAAIYLLLSVLTFMLEIILRLFSITSDIVGVSQATALLANDATYQILHLGTVTFIFLSILSLRSIVKNITSKKRR
jgi:hypothetical protein